MIVAIRISGQVNKTEKVEETLFRMRLRRKYSAVLMEDNKNNRDLLESMRNFIAYGEISSENLVKLIELRGQVVGKAKIDAKKVASELAKKKLEDVGLKPFFRLHPPRKGIESKKHFPAGGVLGNNGAKINDLLVRML